MPETPQSLTPKTYLDAMREKLRGREVGTIPSESISRCVRAEVGGYNYLFNQLDNHERYVDVSIFTGEPLVKGSKSLAQLTVHLPKSATPWVEIIAQECEGSTLEEILGNITPQGFETFGVAKVKSAN